MPVLRGGKVNVDTLRAPLLRCTVTRDATVLALLRGEKNCCESTRERIVPLGPRVGSVDVVIGVDLTGGLARVRIGAVCLAGVLAETVAAIRAVEVHLPSAQVGVVLPGAVRAGTEVLPDNIERVKIFFGIREGGGTLLSRGPVVTAIFRAGRVFKSLIVGRTRGLVLTGALARVR